MALDDDPGEVILGSLGCGCSDETEESDGANAQGGGVHCDNKM